MMISIDNKSSLYSSHQMKDLFHSYISLLQHNSNNEEPPSDKQSYEDISSLLSHSASESFKNLKNLFSFFESRLLGFITNLNSPQSPEKKEDALSHSQVINLLQSFLKSLSSRLDALGREEKEGTIHECQSSQMGNIFQQRTLSRDSTRPYSTVFTEAELEDMPTPKFRSDESHKYTFTTNIFQSNADDEFIISNQTKFLLQCTYKLYKNNKINKRQRTKLKEMIYEKDSSLFSIINNINIREELSIEKILSVINPHKSVIEI